MIAMLRSGLLASFVGVIIATAPAVGAEQPIKIRLSVDEDPIVPRLAESLGYLKREGIEIVRVKVEDFAKEDYLLQKPLIDGNIDAAYHWFNHAVFGAHHNLPVTAVMVFNDAPGMTLMVANRVKDQIHGAADFKGRNIAQGAGYGTKSVLTNYLARRAGLPPRSYTSVMVESAGRQEAVIKGLKAGAVDVMTFQEPLTSALMATGMVSTLYDLTSGDATTQVLGTTWPAQSLLMAPAYIKAHPDRVQHLVNAFVSTMRYLNNHSVEQILALLPPDYFAENGREAQTAYLRHTFSTFARHDYALTPAAVGSVFDSVQGYDFDGSEEGVWRRSVDNPHVDPKTTYDNRFVDKAMHTFQ